MDNKGKNTFLRSSIIYGVFALLLFWLIFFNEFVVGDLGNFLPYLPEQLALMSLDVILLPLLVSLFVFYVASLMGTAFEGVFAEVMVGTLYAVGFAAFFTLFLILHPASTLSDAGYLLLAAFSVVLAYNTISTISRLKKIPSLQAVAVSATIYIEGQIAIKLISLLIASSGTSMPPEMGVAVGQFINLGVTIAAVFTLFAVFKTSQNPYLSALGSIASNYLFSVSLSLLGALYYGFFLGGLSSFAPSITNLSPYIEWTGICVFAALIFTVMRRGMQDSMMAKNRLGEWKKHLQQVTTYKGDRFVGFTEIIDDFVERGNRDRLLVRLALFLHENRVSDDEISTLLAELINYEDEKKPALSQRGRASTIDKGNRERRMNILQRTISSVIPSGVEETVESSGVEEDISQTASAMRM
jgi:hypothetical protein